MTNAYHAADLMALVHPHRDRASPHRRPPRLGPRKVDDQLLMEFEEELWNDTAMKVFLDDERPTPEGWTGVRWPDEAIELLRSEDVEAVSLDHDLGDDERGTGYDVLLWIEEAVVTRGFDPPAMSVHSANSSARARMMAAISAIYRLHARLNPSHGEEEAPSD